LTIAGIPDILFTVNYLWMLAMTFFFGLSLGLLSARTWTDVDGRTIDAEFDSYDPDAGKVTILRDGKAFRVALETFCEADIA